MLAIVFLSIMMIWPQTQEQIFKELKNCLGCFKSAQSDPLETLKRTLTVS